MSESVRLTMVALAEGAFVLESGDLWQRRITRRFLDRAPRVAPVDGQMTFYCPNSPVARVSVNCVPWRNDPLASTDLWVRDEAMSAAAISAQVVCPTFAWGLFAMDDEALQAASIQSYNNWTADLCVANPTRLYPAILLPAGAAGVDELKRCAATRVGNVKMALAIVADDRPEIVAPTLEAASSQSVPVLLVRPGGPVPATDLSAFCRETAALAQRYAANGAELVCAETPADFSSGRMSLRFRRVSI